MANILQNEEEFAKYKNSVFNERGYETLKNYLGNLIDIYIKDDVYPKRIGWVYGLPLMNYAQTFRTKEELLSRIFGYAHILGLKKIFLQKDGAEIEFEFGGENGRSIKTI